MSVCCEFCVFSCIILSVIRGVLWISDSCECCVLSGRGLCDGLINCTEESHGCLSVLIVVFCQVEFARRADHLYRGVL